MFFAGCGRLFEGTAQQLDRALYEVLGALPGATRIYCAHEYTQSNLRFAASVDPDNPDLQRIRAEVDRLRARGESTVPSTLEVERQVNPFLRCDTDAIRRATGHGPEAARHEVLGALRRMKDHF